MSASILKASSGKLDIKRLSPSILYIEACVLIRLCLFYNEQMAFEVISVMAVMTNCALIGMNPQVQKLLPSDITAVNIVLIFVVVEVRYSKTCLKRPLQNRQNKSLKDKW